MPSLDAALTTEPATETEDRMSNEPDGLLHYKTVAAAHRGESANALGADHIRYAERAVEYLGLRDPEHPIVRWGNSGRR